MAYRMKLPYKVRKAYRFGSTMYGRRKRRPMMRRRTSRTEAKIAGRNTARKIFRAMRRKSKRSISKIFSNFAGKVAYKKVSSMRKKRRY